MNERRWERGTGVISKDAVNQKARMCVLDFHAVK